jgi:hypothetical protein
VPLIFKVDKRTVAADSMYSDGDNFQSFRRLGGRRGRVAIKALAARREAETPRQ